VPHGGRRLWPVFCFVTETKEPLRKSQRRGEPITAARETAQQAGGPTYLPPPLMQRDDRTTVSSCGESPTTLERASRLTAYMVFEV